MAGRRIYYLSAVAIVAIVLISAIAVTRPMSIQTLGPSGSQKTMQVTGAGTASAAPDQAILLLALQTRSVSATQASDENAAIMSRVINALINIGIGKSSIETTSYSLVPIYESKPDETAPPRIIGYAVRNGIQVTLNDLTLIGNAIDSAIAAGANEVQGVMFTLSPDAYARVQTQALQIALQDADGKAKALASTLGVSIVGPISVTPGYSFQPILERSVMATPTPIQPGTLQVTATVQVVYEFA